METRSFFGFHVLMISVCLTLVLPVVARNQTEPMGNNDNRSPTVQSRQQALSDLINEKLRLEQLGDRVQLVRTLNLVVEVQLKLRDLKAAGSAAEESLVLARQLEPSDTLLVDALLTAGRVHLGDNDNPKALSRLTEAEDLSRTLKYRSGEAHALTLLALAHYQSSNLSAAEKNNDLALEIWRELGDRENEARTLTHQGETYMLLDRPEDARAMLERAEAIWQSFGAPTELASTLIDLNFLAARQGQWQLALGFLSRAAQLITDVEAEPYLAGQIATSFGEAYEAYGQLPTALTHFHEALRLYRDHAHDTAAAADAASKAGRVKAKLGDHVGGLKQIEEGLALARQINDELRLGLCREELGRVWLLAGSYQQARAEFAIAIAHFEKSGNRRPWARAQTYLGQTDYLLGNLGSAKDSYRKAMSFFRSTDDYTNEAALSFGLGKLALREQKLDEAGGHLERSIALTEQLRENASSKELRSSFLASVHHRYETYVEWLMARHGQEPHKGFNVQAFEANERGRARSLVDSLGNYQRELRQATDPALLLTEEKLQKEIQKLLDQKAELISVGATTNAKASLEDQLVKVQSRYDALQAQIKTNARFTDLFRPAPLTLGHIKEQVVDADTMLIEYSLGEQQSYLWLVTATGLKSYELPPKRTIEDSARRLVDLFSVPDDERLEAAVTDLSKLILSPVAGELTGRRLIIVPDGILQYVPFQSLTISTKSYQPLIADFEIVNAPSASTIAMVTRTARDRPVGPNLIAAFGNPVLPKRNLETQAVRSRDETSAIDSSRSIEFAGNDAFAPDKLTPLFFAPFELNQLRKFGQQDSSVIYSDYSATRDNLRQLDLAQYRILHFATHGFLDAKQPELSGLVLSMVDVNNRPLTGFVGLADIYQLRAPVDLVVLSACQTALGTDVRGEGLIGLTRGFMYAGASSVVASLWKVDDDATAELMKHFYSNMFEKGMTAAAALRAAQNTIREQSHWRSPYYWAAFTLQGDYQQVIKPASQPWSRHKIVWLIALLGVIALGLYGCFLSFRRRAPGRPITRP